MWHYIGDPDIVRSLALSPFSGCLTRLRADDVKSRRLCHPSVNASLGFTLMLWKANVITHHMPSPVPFHSLQVLLLLATQWPLEPWSRCWGEPCGGLAASLQYTISTVCFLSRGSVVRIPGMHPHLQWNRILLLAMSPYSTVYNNISHWTAGSHPCLLPLLKLSPEPVVLMFPSTKSTCCLTSI
jgi:hypothetical protein